jgi:hypothetical protein
MDVLGGGVPEPGEIDWDRIREWKGGDAPAFAGRYFLGTPTDQEVNAGDGFCLWAHGEGTDPSTPMAVAPLQRSDPARQEALGSTGEQFGSEDARAIATYLERCADVGDLAPPVGRYLVLVYLEVAVGTNLSFDYWSMWAHTVKGTLLELHPQGLVRPLEPAIACAFEQASAEAPFVPAEAVRTCLSHPAPPGRHSLCHGFWCQTVLDDPVFGQFVQDPDEGRIPIRYRRTFDGPGGSPLPDPAAPELLSTLRLITVDEPTMDPDDPTLYTLETLPWDPAAAQPPDTTSLPLNLPTQLGIDTAYFRDEETKEGTSVAARGRIVRCMATKEIVVRRLPAGFFGPDFGFDFEIDLGTRLEGPDTLRGRPTFVARYLAPHYNRLDTQEEVMDLFAAGMEICSVWQVGQTFTAGSDHGKDAFTEAAKLEQPPHTPVYFAVDLSVGNPDGMHDADTVSPPLAQVVEYFRDIRRGYRQYLAEGGTVPYYVGCYAARNVLDAVYRAGLATHFWQVWAFNWGPPTPVPPDWSTTAPGWRAWPHLNFWQVLLEDGHPDLLDDNADILGCTPVLDFDVAWGDPGSWVPG